MKQLILTIIATLLALASVDARPKPLKAWSEGTMDIHHISTGRGPAIFFILPDGTRMLVDAGDLGDTSRIKQKIMPAVPNNAVKRWMRWV